ncbi:hypothetical protein Goarm_020293 [Gossypium armourianum]|uniref:DUF4283 domain-containing protein n=1 Tax=Gossypium armourianum TaxID=34283 RepID=A0A7J9IP45_9ROSI|nr:hypothetical protein [Gossypium armourianum]
MGQECSLLVSQRNSACCGWVERGGGFAIMGRDEIPILKEELVQLTVKSLRVVPNKNPTLLCSIWTKKSYNPDSFRAQMRSIWKTKKFEIQRASQNLFFILFVDESDLEIGRETLAKKKSVNKLGKWKLDLVDTREDEVPIIDMTCVKRSQVGDKDHDGDGSTNKVMVTLELCSNPSNLISVTAIKPTKCNENHQLKCPWSKESTDN